MNTSVVSVGIDVGKAKLDVACMHQDRSMVHQVFNNNVKGIRSLRSFLKQQRTASTVPCTLELTGAYHLLVALSLSEVGYRVNCVNPIITKKYMKATVRDAKSDKIDLKRIAELGYPSHYDQTLNSCMFFYQMFPPKTAVSKDFWMNAYTGADFAEENSPGDAFKETCFLQNEQVNCAFFDTVVNQIMTQ